MRQLITEAALANNINAHLLASLIHQESRGNRFAIRREDGFEKKYLKGKTIKQLGGYVPEIAQHSVEYYLRACSLGLCQIMGQTARELGFSREWLTELFDPEHNISLGARFLSKCLERTSSMEQALLRYNGGADLTYPNKVMGILQNGDFHYLLTD